jgi:CBS domain-containing protein
MPARRKISVAPRSDGGWAVSSGRTTLSTHRRKETAVAAGRRQAKRQVPSQLTIKGSDGRIQDQRSYELSSTARTSRTRRASSQTRKTRSTSKSSGGGSTTSTARARKRTTGTKRSTSSTSKRSAGRRTNQKVREIMTPNPRTLPMTATVGQAAETMRMIDAGTVLVADDAQRVVGIVTDRDIAIRAVAEGRDPFKTMVGDISTPSPATVTPGTSVRDAVKLMRQLDIRRLPVVEGERAVGVVSLGDLAILQDPASALADISAAPSTDRVATGRGSALETSELLEGDVRPTVQAVDELDLVAEPGAGRNIERTSPAGMPEDVVVLPESEEPASTRRRASRSTSRR